MHSNAHWDLQLCRGSRFASRKSEAPAPHTLASHLVRCSSHVPPTAIGECISVWIFEVTWHGAEPQDVVVLESTLQGARDAAIDPGLRPRQVRLSFI